jgi:hypothetical protein
VTIVPSGVCQSTRALLTGSPSPLVTMHHLNPQQNTFAFVHHGKLVGLLNVTNAHDCASDIGFLSERSNNFEHSCN